MIRAREERPQFAIFLMLMALICFTGIDTSAKWLVQAGMPIGEIVFIRYFAHLLIVLAAFSIDHQDSLWKMKAPGLTLLRGLTLLVSTGVNFIALQYLPLTTTSAIFFIAPLLITGLGAIFLAEKVGPRRWAAIMVGLFGVVIVTRPWGASFHWSMLIALALPVSQAIYSIATRQLSGLESPITMQFWAALIPVVFIAPFAFEEWMWPVDFWSWAAFLAIGAFGWGGHQIFTIALRYANVSALAPISYAQILFMTASSWLIFHQPPDGWTLAGGAVIVLSGLYVWLRERRLAKR